MAPPFPSDFSLSFVLRCATHSTQSNVSHNTTHPTPSHCFYEETIASCMEEDSPSSNLTHRGSIMVCNDDEHGTHHDNDNDNDNDQKPHTRRQPSWHPPQQQ
ncbi:hypothetical protein AAZX31_02G120700 [Glycine max]